jgi:ribosome-binding factor A
MQDGTSKRSHRVADTIMREVSLILLEEIKDPRLEMVSISGVRLNRDMTIATLLYTHSGDEQKKTQVAKALDSANGYIRSLVGKRLNLRRTPELRFKWDDFLEEMVYGQRTGTDHPDTTNRE